MDTICKDCLDIIFDYKKDFENYDKNFKLINQVLLHKKNYVEVNMNYNDIKEYLLIHNINSIYYNINNINGLFKLDLIRDDDSFLDFLRVKRFSLLFNLKYKNKLIITLNDN